ncbi:MAG: VWA domain-containing protein [Chloroflexi bacterium]|nr:VWA domain-containing protein [Chloroflexota bacterium]
MANELNLTVTLNKPSVPVTSTQQLIYLLIETKPNEVISRTRMPMNLGFVLDRSGSMKGDKIKRLKEAMSLAVGRLNPDDRVSVTIFNDSARVVARNDTLSKQRNLEDQIRRLQAGGGTQMSRGMSLGLREVYRHWNEGWANQLILLTDGQTYGDEAQCLKLAKEAGEHHIAIQALGLGDEWNESLLDQVGSLSGGDADLIESADEVVPLFTQTVERSQQAVVRDAAMTLRLVSDVTPRQVWQVTPVISNLGYQPLGEHDVQVSLGDVDAVEGKAVLVELLIPPRRAGRYRVAQAEVRGEIPAQQTSGTSVRQDVVLDYTQDAAQANRYDSRVMNIVEKVTVYRLQTRALEEARMGDVAGATRKLRAAATRLLELGEPQLAEAAQEEASNLEQSGQMTSMGTKKLRYQTRKLTQRLPELPE